MFARVSGYGLSLVPIWPYRFERTATRPGSVTVTHWGGDAVRTATVHGPAHDPAVELSNADSADQVVDISAGPVDQSWRVETSLYSVAWPEGFRIEPPPDGGPSMFDLHGPDGALLYVQGPFADDRLPTPDQLVAPGQTVVVKRRVRDVEVVELAYVHEDAEWRQGYWLVPLGEGRSLVVTAQAPAARAAETMRAGDLVAGTPG
ncbi:MAG: hypothetical protein ACRDOO_17720 [Actinomadura sp.]